MSEIVIVDRDGYEKRLKAQAGVSVMQTLRDADVGIAAICGGMCSCATCHVLLDEAWVATVVPPRAEEMELLGGLTHSQPNSRLSCQIPFHLGLDGLRLTIAPEE
jgi:2Fe-2S ferredoxin